MMPVSRLRVAHVITVPEFARYVLLHDLRRLAARSDATVFCADGPDVAFLRSELVRVIAFPIQRKLSPFGDLIAIVALWRHLRRAHFDIVHTYLPKGGLIGQVAAWLARVPRRVHSCRGLLYTPDMPAWRRHLFRLTDRLTYHLCHRAIFISRADLEFTVTAGLCPRERARFTGSGIDLKIYDRASAPSDARARLRTELGLPADARIVLTIGRFVVEKGYRELTAAAQALTAADRTLHFVWVAPLLSGEDGVLPDDWIQTHGLNGRVHRLGVRQDLVTLYAASDLLAHASYREGVPRVLMEAAAMELPVVASDIPGCREVLAHGVTGHLVPPRDAPALTTALDEALRNSAETARLTAAALVDVRSRFDQDALTERVWAIYRELADV